MWSEDTAFVSQGSGQALPSSTTAESFIYSYKIWFILFVPLFIYWGPWAPALWCTVFPSCAPICVGSWISFLTFPCRSILVPSLIQAFLGLWRSWSFQAVSSSTFSTGYHAGLPAGAEPSHSLYKPGPCRPPLSPPWLRPSQCREKSVFPSHTQTCLQLRLALPTVAASGASHTSSGSLHFQLQDSGQKCF